MSQFKIATKCVQSGYSPKNGEPRVIPIAQSTTFKYDSSVRMAKLFDLEEDGFFYTRLANPTVDAVEKKIADLEGGVMAILTSSGQAASMYSVLNVCKAGDHLISSSAIYGGTYNLFNKTLRDMGVEVDFIEPDASAEEIDRLFRENTKCVFTEMLSNPALTVLDLEKWADAAHSHGVPLVVVPPANTWTVTHALSAELWLTAAGSTGETVNIPCSPSLTRHITVSFMQIISARLHTARRSRCIS